MSIFSSSPTLPLRSFSFGPLCVCFMLSEKKSNNIFPRVDSDIKVPTCKKKSCQKQTPLSLSFTSTSLYPQRSLLQFHPLSECGQNTCQPPCSNFRGVITILLSILSIFSYFLSFALGVSMLKMNKQLTVAFMAKEKKGKGLFVFSNNGTQQKSADGPSMDSIGLED